MQMTAAIAFFIEHYPPKPVDGAPSGIVVVGEGLAVGAAVGVVV